MTRRAAGDAGLEARLLALDEAVALGEGIVDPALLAPARGLVARAGERLGHGLEHTVVALAGATGSGKSSLFNALVGEPVSRVGVRRPTTSRTTAAVWGAGAEPLLDWLEVPARHVVPADAEDAMPGLVLLDLPDHDSTALEHRAEVDRVVGIADSIVWVLDPQKYADAAVHERYLRPLASHAGVLLLVLNQADRLEPTALAACRADLAKLLADDGLSGVEVLATSAVTGVGVEHLRAFLGRRAAERRAALTRLGADVTDTAEGLGEQCRGRGGAAPGRGQRQRLIDAMAEAAGLRAVTDAVAGTHRAQGVRRVGWPFTRWLGRLRPDPLRRLHLQPDAASTARTSLPAPTDVARARLATAVRDLSDDARGDLPPAWSEALRAGHLDGLDSLSTRLDATVAETRLGAAGRPRWWSVVAALQRALAAVAAVGGVWLAALAVLGYLQLGDPGTPDLGEIPVPTAMLLGGGLAGLLVAALARPIVALGARRRARRAERRLREALAALADEALLAPAAWMTDRYRRYCEAVGRAGGT